MPILAPKLSLNRSTVTLSTKDLSPIKQTRKKAVSKPRPIIASEYAECLTLVQHLDLLKRTGRIKQYTHIPNETYTTSWNAKRKNRAMGVMSGFPDYVIITNTKVIHIEMKKSKGGVTSDSQKEWIEALNSVGSPSAVCAGYDQAILFLNNHL
jgi:hypothetical protein